MIYIKYPNENQVVLGKNVGIKKIHHKFSFFFNIFFPFKQIKVLGGGRFFLGTGGDENLKIYLVWPYYFFLLVNMNI